MITSLYPAGIFIVFLPVMALRGGEVLSAIFSPRAVSHRSRRILKSPVVRWLWSEDSPLRGFGSVRVIGIMAE